MTAQRKAVKSIVVARDSEDNPLILFLARAEDEFGLQGVLDLPGGEVGEDESFEDTLVRESIEEMGLDLLKQWSVESSTTATLSHGPLEVEIFFPIFNLGILAEELPIELSKEHSRHVWLSPDDIRGEQYRMRKGEPLAGKILQQFHPLLEGVLPLIEQWPKEGNTEVRNGPELF